MEAIKAVRVKFLWQTYDHLNYPHTKFYPILMSHAQNFVDTVNQANTKVVFQLMQVVTNTGCTVLRHLHYITQSWHSLILSGVFFRGVHSHIAVIDY